MVSGLKVSEFFFLFLKKETEKKENVERNEKKKKKKRKRRGENKVRADERESTTPRSTKVVCVMKEQHSISCGVI